MNKTIRYYGAYAAKNHRFEGKVEKLYKNFELLQTSYFLRDWRLSIVYNFNRDPLKCECGSTMERTYSLLPSKGGGVIHEIFYKRQEKKYEYQGWEQRTGYCPQN